jgi:hypothetical protein
VYGTVAVIPHHALDTFYCHVLTDDDGFDWRPVEDSFRYKQARDGDHLLTAFQCDLCWFRNLQQRDPLSQLDRDDLLLCCIRRANLDAVWGREPLTVQATLRSAIQLMRLWDKVGMSPQFPLIGPFPVRDSLGMGVTVAMLLKSLEPGKYHASYQQFETVRKLRAGFANIYMASVEGVSSLRTVGGGIGPNITSPKVLHNLSGLNDSPKAAFAGWGKMSGRTGQSLCLLCTVL